MEFLLFNLSFGIANNILLEIESKIETDITPMDLESQIDELNLGEKGKEKLTNFIENLLGNPLLGRMFIFLFLCLPILNIVLFVHLSISIIKNLLNK